MAAEVETSNWSGEGTFTQVLVDCLKDVGAIALLKVEDAPASRSDADYNFVSNELFVLFATVARGASRFSRFGFLPASRTVVEPALTLVDLEAVLTAMPDVGCARLLRRSRDAAVPALRTDHPAVPDARL